MTKAAFNKLWISCDVSLRTATQTVIEESKISGTSVNRVIDKQYRRRKDYGPDFVTGMIIIVESYQKYKLRA